MSLRFPKHSRFGLIWLSVLALVAVLHASPGQAYPVLDQEIYYHGGSLQFQILPSSAGYTSQIYLHTGTGSILLGNNTNPGVVINLSNPSSAGLMPGDEFILGIHVINTGNDFVMGGGYDNPDGIAHAAVDYLYNHNAVIGFEDLFGGGDLDYNDARIRVIGDIGFLPIPEPSPLILFGAGLIGLMFYRIVKITNSDGGS